MKKSKFSRTNGKGFLSLHMHPPRPTGRIVRTITHPPVSFTSRRIHSLPSEHSLRPGTQSQLPIVTTDEQIQLPVVSIRQPEPILQNQSGIQFREPIQLRWKQPSKAVPAYDLANNLQLQVKARFNFVRLSSRETQYLPVLINLKANELTREQDANRPPIDLVCVIDVSVSMTGPKLRLVQSTLKRLL